MTLYEKRVQELEAEGLTTSDAQGVADLEFMQKAAPRMFELIETISKWGKVTSPEAIIQECNEVLRLARGEA